MAIAINNNTFRTVPVFSENQVLRARDLNNLVNAVFDQLRQNRIFNIGLGITDGFSVDWSEPLNALVVRRGFGVSSDGYAFDLQECRFTHFRRASGLEEDYKKLVYACTEYDALLQQIGTTGYELGAPTPTEAMTGSWEPLAGEQATTAISEGTYCLLYLYREPRLNRSSCFSDCEVLGDEQVGNYHAILVPAPPPDQVVPDKKLEPLLPVPRLRAFGREGEEVKLCRVRSWEELYAGYREPCLALNESLAKVYATAVYRLEPPEKDENGEPSTPEATDFYADTLALLNGLVQETYPAEPGENCTDVQYLYAYYRELIVAYAELFQLLRGKTIILEGSEEQTTEDLRCLFSGHLGLRTVSFSGEVGAAATFPEESADDDRCRTRRILPNNGEESRSVLTEAKTLLGRMKALVSGNNLRLATWEGDGLTDLRFTPGARRFPFLRGRALPFYYKSTLVNQWRVGEQALLETYHYVGLDEDHPLLFATEDYDFYRVEGHLAQLLSDPVFTEDNESATDRGVKARIEELRDCLNLSFDVVAVSLEPGEKEDEIGETDRDRWYKNTRNDLLGTLLPLVPVDKEPGSPGTGDADPDLLEACRRVIGFLRNNATLGGVDDWEGLEDLDLCADLPPTFTSSLLDVFVQSYEFLVDAIELARQEEDKTPDADGSINSRENSYDELPFLDRRLADCIREAAVAERLFREASWRSTCFAGFANAHPGMVHRGGVPVGGTLVLVHKREQNDTAILEQIRSLRRQGLERPGVRKELERLFRQLRSGQPTVVADFCLPYRCCGAAPVNLIVQPAPPLTLRVVQVACSGPETDDNGLPVILSVSESGGTLTFTPGGEETVTVAENGEYRVQGLQAADFTDGQLIIGVNYTLGERTVATEFIVQRTPRIGDSSLAYAGVAEGPDGPVIQYNFTPELIFSDTDIRVSSTGTSITNLFDPATGLVSIPLANVLEGGQVIVRLNNGRCLDERRVDPCAPLPTEITIKGGCAVTGTCEVDCPEDLGLTATDDVAFTVPTQENDELGLLELCPEVPGGNFRVIDFTALDGTDVELIERSGLVMRNGNRYFLVFDLDLFSAATTDNTELDCLRNEAGLFPFQTTDQFPSGTLLSVTLAYDFGRCERVSRRFQLLFPGEQLDPVFVTAALVTEPSTEPVADFPAVLNARRNARLNELNVLRATETEAVAEEAFKRTVLYVSDTGQNVNPKRGLTDVLQALQELRGTTPEVDFFVRKSGEVLATSFLDKLALVGKKTQLTKTRKNLLQTLREGLDALEVNRNTAFSAWRVSELYEGVDKTRLTNIGKALRE